MPNKHRVKFDEQGKRCPKNIQQLRRLPECGVFGRELLPFTPHEKPPPPPPTHKDPFKPQKMHGIPHQRTPHMPDKPTSRTPQFPNTDRYDLANAVGPGSQFTRALAQDETNLAIKLFRQPLPDTRVGYERIPQVNEISRSAEGIEMQDSIAQAITQAALETGGDQTMPAAVSKQPLIPDPRNGEFIPSNLSNRGAASSPITGFGSNNAEAGTSSDPLPRNQSIRRVQGVDVQQQIELMELRSGPPPSPPPSPSSSERRAGRKKTDSRRARAKFTSPKKGIFKSRLTPRKQMLADMSQAAYIQNEAMLNYFSEISTISEMGYKIDMDHTNQYMKTFVNFQETDENGRPLIATVFRGTESGVLAGGLPDLDDANNLGSAVLGSRRLTNAQTDEIDGTMRSIFRTYNKYPDYYGGHSRGGAEVQYVKNKFGGGGRASVVFNSAPFATAFGEDGIQRIRTPSDIVSIADAHRSTNVPVVEGETSHAMSNFARPIPSRLPRRLMETVSETELADFRAPAQENPTETSSLIGGVTQARGSEAQRTMGVGAQDMAERFQQHLSSKASEAGQTIRNKFTRSFGQQYNRIVPMPAFELDGANLSTQTDLEGNIHIQAPITEIEMTDFRLDLAPLDESIDAPTVRGGRLPKLTLKERLSAVRDSFADIPTRTGAVTAGSAGVGFLTGLALNSAFGGLVDTGNQYADATLLGLGSGAASDLTARTAGMIGERALGVAGTDAAVFTAERTGITLLRGGVEGGAVGMVFAPVDLLLNNMALDRGYSHTQANVATSTGTGLVATSIIGGMAFAAAPETFGLSLVVGLLATAAGAGVAAAQGANEDNAEEQSKIQTQQDMIAMADGRRKFVATLAGHNYNFNEALSAFTDKTSLHMDDESWPAFSTSARSIFNSRPSNLPPSYPSTKHETYAEVYHDWNKWEYDLQHSRRPTLAYADNDDFRKLNRDLLDPDHAKREEFRKRLHDAKIYDDQNKMNDLYSTYIRHTLINRVCSEGSAQCEQLTKTDPGDLSDKDVKFMDETSGGTWKSQADMQAEMSYQELQFTSNRIADAKKTMINEWNTNQRLITDDYVRQTAFLDPNFEASFNQAIKDDAQRRVINAYYTDQTQIDDMSASIQHAANLDPGFAEIMNTFYSQMQNGATNLEVTIPQLIQLQRLTGEEQRRTYEGMQFDRVKEQPDVVSQAEQLAAEQDRVRRGKIKYYDIDQAYLENADPTDKSKWHPTDSQILQAHNAGMTLIEYVGYMHQLALGDAGDFSKLPTYSQDQLRKFGEEDDTNFKNELGLAGYDPALYDYDPDTRMFTLNANVRNAQSLGRAHSFVSQLTPSLLLKTRTEYANMIHGLNETSQADVDTYNANLRRQLSEFADQYDEMVSQQNLILGSMAHAPNVLLHYDSSALFNKYRLNYHPISDQIPNVGDTLDTAITVGSQPSGLPNLTEKQRRRKLAAEKYGISVDQYEEVKRQIQAENVRNPTQEKVDQETAKVISSSSQKQMDAAKQPSVP